MLNEQFVHYFKWECDNPIWCIIHFLCAVRCWWWWIALSVAVEKTNSVSLLISSSFFLPILKHMFNTHCLWFYMQKWVYTATWFPTFTTLWIDFTLIKHTVFPTWNKISIYSLWFVGNICVFNRKATISHLIRQFQRRSVFTLKILIKTFFMSS